jgi:hypothetical protein
MSQSQHTRGELVQGGQCCWPQLNQCLRRHNTVLLVQPQEQQPSLLLLLLVLLLLYEQGARSNSSKAPSRQGSNRSCLSMRSWRRMEAVARHKACRSPKALILGSSSSHTACVMLGHRLFLPVDLLRLLHLLCFQILSSTIKGLVP